MTEIRTVELVVQEISDRVIELIAIKKDLHAQQSAIDVMVNDIYHVVEFVDLTDEEAVFLLKKKLKVALETRRQIKEQISIVDGLYDVKLGQLAKEEEIDSRVNRIKENAENRFKSNRDKSFESANRLIGFPFFIIPSEQEVEPDFQI